MIAKDLASWSCFRHRREEGEALFAKSLTLHKLEWRTEAASLANEALQIFRQLEAWQIIKEN